MRDRWLISFLLFSISQLSCGQVQHDQYHFVEEASRYAKSLYSENYKLRIYHGTRHVPILINREIDKGSPYYLRDVTMEENVTSDGVEYSKIRIVFDLIQNEVVSVMPGTGAFVSLATNKIDRFTLSGHTFVNLKKESIRQPDFKPGFYDLLYDGKKIKVFAKRIKVYSESSNTIKYGAAIQKVYTDKSEIFLLKDEHLFAVKNKKTLLSLINDKKSQIDSYIERSRLKISKNNFEKAIVDILKEYDQL
jgi:hypothetical protein